MSNKPETYPGGTETPFNKTVMKTEDFLLGMKRLYEGRLKTIIDASIADPQQRKAIKDLVRDAIWAEEAWSKSIFGEIYKLLRDNTDALTDYDAVVFKNRDMRIDGEENNC